jgi:hypothetical protein
MGYQKYDSKVNHTANHQYSIACCPADMCSSFVSKDDILENLYPEKMLPKIYLQAKNLMGC